MNTKKPFLLTFYFVLFCISAAMGGPLTRVANTTLKMPSQPPTFGFTHANAFSGLTFTDPVAIATPPGETNRLFIVQKTGQIIVITNLAAPTKTTFMDISAQVIFTDSNSGGTGEQGLLGLAFHPGYATNRLFFVWYTGNATTAPGTGRHDILARFQTSSTNPNSAPTNSQQRFIVQKDDQPNHNAGDIKFGADGYLYIPVSDEGGGDDSEANSQKITKDLFSAVMRIDVDKKAGNLTPNAHAAVVPNMYLIPNDNPFIGVTSFNGASVDPTKVHTEFWAVGFRNPWRMDFDPETGLLYLADVGQSSREEVDVVRKGKNYGWQFFEGTLQRNTPPSSGFTHTPPIAEYSHANGRVCIIGGGVYRGTRLSQLTGAYVYAEYATGEFFFLRYNGTSVTSSGNLFTDGSGFPCAMGRDPRNGDILYCRAGTSGVASSATIHKINYNSTTNGAPIPPTLADTGAFSSTANLAVNSGIVPYDINVHFWSDNAIKSRWFSVPNTSLDMTFAATNNWSFPTGTVWIKHFDLELTNGVPSSRKRLETRFIVKNSGGVYGVTYRWGTSTTNATLVAEEGADDVFVIRDSGGGIVRTQTWHYPSRSECLACHTSVGGFGLGFNTPQMNRLFNYSGTDFNQVQALSDAGYFTAATPDPATLAALTHPTNTSGTLEQRAKGYLTANCVQCHSPGGPTTALWDARYFTPMTQAGIINGTLEDNLGDANNRVVAPQDLAHSVLHARISTRGVNSIQMPPLASSIVDSQDVAVVEQWINSMNEGFWVNATPYSRTITAGGSGTTFSISSLDVPSFAGTVALSVSGVPSGMTATFSPTSVNPPAGSTLTVSADGSTTPGIYTLSVVGTSGASQTEPQDIVVKVDPATTTQLFEAEALSFTTNGAAGVLQVDAAASAGQWIQLVADSLNDSITFTIPGLAAGTYNVDLLYKAHPNRSIVRMAIDNVTQGSDLDQFAATPVFTEADFGNVTLGAGSHTFKLTAVGSNAAAGSLSISADAFRLTLVGTPTPDFTIVGTPTSRTVNAGNSTNYTATIGALNGFTGTVTFSASGLPSGASANFSPTTVSGSGSSTMTVSTSPSTPGGTSTITITGTSGSLVHSTNVSLTVNVPPPPPTNFTLSVTPASQTIIPGGPDVTYTVNSTATNFTSAVTLSLSGLPSGATASFSPNPITPPQSSTLTISADSSTAPNTYPLTVTGIGGGLTRTAGTSLVVSNNSPPPASILQEAEWLAIATNGAAANVVADSLASGGQWVSLLSTNSGPWIEYTVTNIPAGIYSIGLLYKQHPNRGIHSLTVDGVKIDGDLNQYSNVVAYPEKSFGNITFMASGNHAVRLTCTGKDAAAGTPNISADAFRLSSTNEVWLSQDIGAVGIPGSFSQNGNQFTIAGSGSDIWTTGDQFRYAYQNVSGDMDLIAKVNTIQNTASFAKAGVMIRQTLLTNSVNAAVLLTPTNGVALQIRPTTGAASINVVGWQKGPVPPTWVRLQRTGNTFTAFHSQDGVAWTQFASTNVTMSAGVTAGMAVTSHNNAALNTSTFGE